MAFRAIAVTLGVVVPIAIVEGLASALVSLEKDRYEPELPEEIRAVIPEDRGVETVPDPYLMYRVKPHIEHENTRTNAYGLRAGPIDRTPAPGVLRVLLLGGSVAWGHDAQDNEDTIARYLEEELTARADHIPALRGRRIEVLNGGVPAYVTWQEALLYAIHLRELRPHWIVTLDGTNDVAAAIYSGIAGAPMRYGAVRRAYLGANASLSGALWAWLVESVQDLKTAKLLDRMDPRSVDDRGARSPAEVAAAMGEAVEHLVDSAKPEGARVLTALQPMPLLPDAKPLTPYEAKLVAFDERRMPGSNRYYAESFAAMRGELAALERERPGFSFLDATGVFSATTGPIFTDHYHLTPRGRRILARRIADGFVEALGAADPPLAERAAPRTSTAEG